MVCEGSPGGSSETDGGRICETDRFKPGEKGGRELWMSRLVNQKRKK